MRVLLVPKLTYVDGTDALTVCPMMLCKAWFEKDHTVSIVMPVHEDLLKEKNWPTRYGLTITQCERITYIPISRDKISKSNAQLNGHLVGPALLQSIGPFSTAKYIDVIVADGVFASHAALRTGVAGTYPRGILRKIPLVGWAEMAATPSSVWQAHIFNSHAAWAEYLGMYFADLICWQSDRVRNDWTREVQKIHKPNIVNEILKKSVTIQTGIKSDQIRYRPSDPDNLKGLWSGYMGRDFSICIPALLTALKSGVLSEITIVVMNHSVDSDSPELVALKKLNKVKVHHLMEHSRFLELIADHDLFLGKSSLPNTYGIRYGEQMAAGLLPVTDEATAEVFLGSLNWGEILGQPCNKYPFIVKGASAHDYAKALMGLAMFLKQNPEARSRLRNAIIEKHDYRVSYTLMYDKVKELVNAHIHTPSYGDFENVVQVALKNKNGIYHTDALRLIERYAKTSTTLDKNPLIVPGVIRWTIMKNGFRDTSTTEEPYYERIYK